MRELATQLVQARSKGGEGTSVEDEDDGVEGVGVGVSEIKCVGVQTTQRLLPPPFSKAHDADGGLRGWVCEDELAQRGHGDERVGGKVYPTCACTGARFVESVDSGGVQELQAGKGRCRCGCWEVEAQRRKGAVRPVRPGEVSVAMWG